MKYFRREGGELILLSILSLAAVSATAQPKPVPRSLLIELNVQKLISAGGQPRPFGSVGLFEVLNGFTPIDKACPSISNGSGLVHCKVQCDPNDSTEVTLLVRPPGADRVPGYESPVSIELAQHGCQLNQNQVGFTYKTLDLALGEVLSSDNRIAQAVTGRSNLSISEVSFGALKPFEQSAPVLKQLAAERSPNFERFSRIMQDAEVSAANAPAAQDDVKWRKAAMDYSTGTRSILLNEAASRSLGENASKMLVPITKDPFQLNNAKVGLAAELKKKQDKTSFDQALEAEILRTTPMPADKFKSKKDVKAMDWNAINRSQLFEERRSQMPERKP